jgi:hypothetical protein
MSDECHCDCHIPGHFAMHVTPCCEVCAGCGKRIAIEKWSTHQQSCGVEVHYDHPETNDSEIESDILSALNFYATLGKDNGELARKTIKKVFATYEESK